MDSPRQILLYYTAPLNFNFKWTVGWQWQWLWLLFFSPFCDICNVFYKIKLWTCFSFYFMKVSGFRLRLFQKRKSTLSAPTDATDYASPALIFHSFILPFIRFAASLSIPGRHHCLLPSDLYPNVLLTTGSSRWLVKMKPNPQLQVRASQSA